MHAQTFLDNFGTIAEAPGGVQRLRDLVVELAVDGRLHDEAGQASSREAQLGDVVELISGQHLKPEEYNETGDGIPYLTGPADFTDSGPVANRWTSERRSVAIEGDVLLTVKGAGIGKLCVLDSPEAAISRQLMAVRPRQVTGGYLRIVLTSLRHRLRAAQVGIAIPGISRSDVLGCPITLPSLPSQERIVAKVGELMQLCDDLEARQQARRQVSHRLRASSLDALTNAATDDDLHTAWSRIHANWETFIDHPQSLEELRQSILQLAMSGRLVLQDPTDEPAAELIARIAAEHADVRPSSRKVGRPTPGPAIDRGNLQRLPTGWVWARFGDVAQIDSNLVDPALHGHEPHVAPDNIEKRTGRLLLPVRSIRDDGVTSSKHRFRAGHILYSKIRPNLSKAVIVDFDGLCSADMYPINAWIDRRFLHAYILSEPFIRQVTREDNRLAMPKVNQSQLVQVLVPVPPLPEQERIVTAINELLGRVNDLEALFGRRALIHGNLATAMCNEVVLAC